MAAGADPGYEEVQGKGNIHELWAGEVSLLRLDIVERVPGFSCTNAEHSTLIAQRLSCVISAISKYAYCPERRGGRLERGFRSYAAAAEA